MFSKKYFEGALVFIVALILMSYIQFNPANPNFSGYDDYYHVEMAQIIKEKGIIHQFPWMQYTVLKDKFVDHHFLFHVLMIPFISLLGAINGAKIFIVLVMALVFLMFYLLLAQSKIKMAFWLALFAIFTMPLDFYFRMNFIRAMGISLLFMTLGLYFIFQKKHLIIALLSFLYVWTYDTFMILPFMALAYGIIQFLRGEKTSWKVPLFSFLGMAAGFIINPYFPDNIAFLKTQMFETGFGAKEYTGGEWRPYDTWYWFEMNYVPLAIFAGGIFLSFVNNLKVTAKSSAIFVTTLLFFVLQWKSKRFVEYTPFFITLSGFFLMQDFIAEKVKEWEKKTFFQKKENIVYGLGIIALLTATYFYSPTQIEGAKKDSRPDFSMSAVEKVQRYLLDHSQEGDIVFTDDWDVFPKYFFVNHKDYYIVGLDPEFMNQYSSDLYAEFASISSGADGENLERIKDDFKAKWVIVGTDHSDFSANLEAHPELFKKIMFVKGNRSESNDSYVYNDGYYLFEVL